MAGFMLANKAVTKRAGSMPKGVKPASLTGSKSSPKTPTRNQAAAVGGVPPVHDPNRHHVLMNEADQRMLGVLPRRLSDFPVRHVG